MRMNKLMGGMKSMAQTGKQQCGLTLTKIQIAHANVCLQKKTAKSFLPREGGCALLYHFILKWCLIKVVMNCMNAKENHISCKDDALVLKFSKLRGAK